MGYSYGHNPKTGRMALACDACPAVGGVRKRRCPHLVADEYGRELPYCTAPALCDACWQARRATLHDACAEPARAASAECAARRERIAAGDLPVRAAWGDWSPGVPEGWTLVLFGPHLPDAPEHWRLVPAGEYRGRGFLSDYPGAVETDVRPQGAEG